MTTAGPSLAMLKDLHQPPPVSIWPLAPGWYVLMLLALALIVLTGYAIYRLWKKIRVRREILTRLKTLQQRAEKSANTCDIIAELSKLLRRAALVYYPREKVASLHGKAWLDFLNRSARMQMFTSPAGELLITAAYQKQMSVDVTTLIKLCRKWVNKACSN